MCTFSPSISKGYNVTYKPWLPRNHYLHPRPWLPCNLYPSNVTSRLLLQVLNMTLFRQILIFKIDLKYNIGQARASYTRQATVTRNKEWKIRSHCPCLPLQYIFLFKSRNKIFWFPIYKSLRNIIVHRDFLRRRQYLAVSEGIRQVIYYITKQRREPSPAAVCLQTGSSPLDILRTTTFLSCGNYCGFRWWVLSQQKCLKANHASEKV